MLVRLWAFLAVFIALPASASADLPEQTKAATICIYNALKVDPAVSGVDVYVPENRGVIIVYGFRLKNGKDGQTALAIVPLLTGHIRYAGDTPEPENPLNSSTLRGVLVEKCDAYGGYTDEVFITGPDNDPLRWHVDMSRYTR